MTTITQKMLSDETLKEKHHRQTQMW